MRTTNPYARRSSRRNTARGRGATGAVVGEGPGGSSGPTTVSVRRADTPGADPHTESHVVSMPCKLLQQKNIKKKTTDPLFEERVAALDPPLRTPWLMFGSGVLVGIAVMCVMTRLDDFPPPLRKPHAFLRERLPALSPTRDGVEERE